jgi:G3E family GTPase
VKKVDLYILSGFLGSGKSTLLRNLIQDERGKGNRIGVLMNELGEISIDSAFIPDDTPLEELLNGCICCTIQGELTNKLYQMLNEHELDTIFIEATGAAHPIEVLDACTHPSLVDKVVMKAIISVVDVKQWRERGTTKIPVRKLLEEQVKYGDIVLLNKIDRLNENEIEQVKKDITERNPKGLIVATTHADIQPELLHEHFEEQRKDRLCKNDPSDPSHDSNDDHSGAHVHHHLHLRTFTQKLDRPLDRIAFEKWLKTLPSRIYRGKGFVQLTETPGLFLFQYAYGEPMFTRFNIEKPYEPVLVLIGDEMDHEKMREELDQLQQASPST